MNPSNNEDIYGNLANNSGLNEDNSLNELKDFAIEVDVEDIKIDMDDASIGFAGSDLYQFDTDNNSTVENNPTSFEYYEEKSYEGDLNESYDVVYTTSETEDNIGDIGIQDINITDVEDTININDDNDSDAVLASSTYNSDFTEATMYSSADEYSANSFTTNEYNEMPTEEDNLAEFSKEILDVDDGLSQEENLSFEYNNRAINNEYSSLPTEDIQEDVSQEINTEYEGDYQRTYTPPYQNEDTDEYVTSQRAQGKRKISPFYMLIIFLVIFFAVLNLPQVKEKINEIKTNNIDKEQVNELNKLSELDNIAANEKQQNIELDKNSKRAKMVVFDEDQKGEETSNVKICANPFLPTMRTEDEQDNTLGAYEIIVPPNTNDSVNSDELSTMMATKVSGILYDKENPQAILNYDGQDQLVSRGDRLAGFYVMSITPDKVILKQGNNVYRVSVGQTVTDEGINYNANSNLGKQFGGRYKDIKEKIINFNNN